MRNEYKIILLTIAFSIFLFNNSAIAASWTLGNASGSTWTDVTYDDTRKSNGQYVRIEDIITDYISYWDFDDGSGAKAYDINQTNANNGTLTNMNTTGNAT